MFYMAILLTLRRKFTFLYNDFLHDFPFNTFSKFFLQSSQENELWIKKYTASENQEIKQYKYLRTYTLRL